MLFDLRGRGRRRTVQAIYLGLALLIGLGLVGFGVGGVGGGGGLFNALEKTNTGSTSFASRVAAAQKRTTKHPDEAAAWGALVEAQLHEASDSPYYETSATAETGTYTSKGKELLHQISNSWNRYLALSPNNPSSSVANNVQRIYSEEGLNEPAEELKALQIVIASRPPSEALFADLAELAYKADNARQGDLASAKAVSLAPALQRPRLKAELEEIKKNPTGSSSSSSSSAAAATSATVVTASTTSSHAAGTSVSAAKSAHKHK